MQWRRQPGSNPADPHGVADLLARACRDVSTSAVEGTRFVFRTPEMLRVSREIEQAAMVDPTVPLYVGCQQGRRLDAQADVYKTLAAAGVRTHAFGVDEGTSVPDVTWTQVPADPFDLAAQWFLVRGSDRPQALVGFELSSHPGGPRRWEGFETHDRLLVEGIITYLCLRPGSRSRRPATVDAGSGRSAQS